MGYATYKRNVEWSEMDIKYVKNNYLRLSVKHLANYLDVDIDAVKMLLKKNDLVNKNTNNKNGRLRNILGPCSDNYTHLLSSMWDFNVNN